jgi:surface polysaccharide O-acyltransferase-like enzyme
MIIAHHYSVHGGWNIGNELSLNKIIIQFLSLGGKLGVNCFVLITGYFMINSKFNIKNLLKITGQVFFYSVIIMILFKLFGLSKIGIKTVIKSIFPVIFSTYWFVTSYVVLYILTPYLNKFINVLNHKEYKQLIILLTVLLSAIPTFTTSSLGIGSVPWFVFLYLIASYLKKYPHNYFDKKLFFFWMFVFGYLSIFLSVIVFNILGLKISVFSSHATYFRNMTTLPMLFCSVSLFLYFKNIEIGSNKIINKIASTTFGIYLIHDNGLMRRYLWDNIAQNNSYLYSSWLFLHALVTITLVFIVCMVIDYSRIILIEKPLFILIDSKWEILIESIKSNFVKKLFLSTIKE